MKKKIIIVGSGIAGLTLANILKKNTNYEFVIYEKNNSLNLDEGYGIQLSVNSVSILNELGFNKLNKKEKYHPSKLDFYKITNQKICELDLTTFNNKENKYTTLKRSSLIKFLRDELFSNSIKFGKKIKEVKQVDKKIFIKFEDDSFDEADYLVISDGVYSKTRSLIEKNKIKSNYYGSVAIRTILNTDEILSFDPKNISLIMAANAHIVLYPVNDQKEINLVCIVRKKLKTNESINEILKKTILKENKNLINLLQGNLISWPIYVSKKPVKSSYQNIFYIGDAFYTFPPSMAQGASQSIESANELFNLIDENKDNIQFEYFKNRSKRTKQIKFRSNFNYFVFHLSNPILRIIRNLVIKFIIKNKNFREIYLGKVFRK
tara:strand:+ start:44 stop:1177 length:1134 start_codon:yes stop_codon:yes gene_type:complete